MHEHIKQYRINQNKKILDLYSDNYFNKPNNFDKSETTNSEKFKKVMKEFEDGELKTSNGEKVIDRDQALAIAYSEAKNS